MVSESLFIDCPACGKKLSSTAKTCTECGHKMKSGTLSKVLQWIAFFFLLMMGIGLMSGGGNDKKSVASSQIDSGNDETNASASDVIVPAKQQALIDIVGTYADKFRQANNELQESSFRHERKQAISSTIKPLFVSSWVGTINELSTNTEGDVSLSVSIAPNVEIKTWNNALSDAMQGTMIKNGSSSLYKKLFDASTGLKIRFNGAFFSSDSDGIEETSMTIRGSMTNPEFLFKFYDVEIIER